MVYYGGNKRCLACLNAAVYFVFWASCSSPHKFSFEFAFVAFNALCFHFEDNGGQGKLTSPNLNFLSFTSYLIIFPLTSVGLFFFTFTCVSCGKNDQTKKSLSLATQDLHVHADPSTHNLFTSGLEFNFMSKLGQEAPV